ncbi:MAG: HAD family phosphatase, partial [Bacteroidota bacterium]
MLHLAPHVPANREIKNIIFDFGGVICDLDISRTEKKFLEFGPAKDSGLASSSEQSLAFDKLVEQYESGAISSDIFRQVIREHYATPPSDETIDDTWNALLVGIPKERIELLEKIRNQYRIFLLSNSNEIHYFHYLEMFRQLTGYQNFNDLFEKAYFSYQVVLSKPGESIFRHVLENSNLVPAETLCI